MCVSWLSNMELKFYMLAACLLTLAHLGYSLAQQAPPNLDELEGAFENNKTQIQEQVAAGEQVMKQRCETNAGDDWEVSYKKIQDARVKLEQCAKNYINMDKLKKDMEEKRKVGKLDEVFKEYCQKKQTIQDCLKDFTETLKPCLKDDEKKNLNVIHNITNQLADFICYKEGDRIALFIAEKGPECMENHTNEIQTCVNTHTEGNITNISTQSLTVTDLANFNLVFNDHACKQIDAVKNCVVDNLKHCTEPTPSNIAEALFKFVRKGTPCNSEPENPQHHSGTGTATCARGAMAAVVTALAAVSLI